MWRRQKALKRLRDKLNALALFDRVHDYSPDHDLADILAHASRQMRRTQIMAEIKELSTSEQGHRSAFRMRSALLLLCAGAYASLRYLFK